MLRHREIGGTRACSGRMAAAQLTAEFGEFCYVDDPGAQPAYSMTGEMSKQPVYVDSGACDLAIVGRRRLSYGAAKRGLLPM